MFCTRLANGGLFPTGDPIVPFVISPRFECLNKRTHTPTLYTHTQYATQPYRSVLWGTSIILLLSLLSCGVHGNKEKLGGTIVPIVSVPPTSGLMRCAPKSKRIVGHLGQLKATAVPVFKFVNSACTRISERVSTKLHKIKKPL